MRNVNFAAAYFMTEYCAFRSTVTDYDWLQLEMNLQF